MGNCPIPVAEHSGLCLLSLMNHHAANLIDSLGLKGFKIGGAHISTKHANFIISDKSASSNDIEKLIDYIQKKVYEEKNIFLETEVKFVGNNI